MSKGLLRGVGIVAGVVALAATGVGALGLAGGLAASSTATTIATYATLAATAANIGAQALAKPPAARGQVNQRTIGANIPLPYLIGEAYSGGVQVHDAGWGGKVGKVQNPYRFIAVVHSCCGPVEGLVDAQTDYASVGLSGGAAGGYFSGFLWADVKLGTRPESAALAPHWGGCPGWSSAHKLSGMAAIGWSLKFDKDGERFASGVPALGAVWKGVKAYDMRKDSTFPGGSGSHRVADESTWEYTRNPALHAATYAYGRHVNGVHVFGPDLGGAAVDMATAAAWANVCDANGWTVNGTITEPGDAWNNLKAICAAGSGVPLFKGGVLTFDYDAPKVALDTIDLDDLADGEITVAGCRAWRDRINQCVPRYRSADHQWSYVAAGAVVDSVAVTADGEAKPLERQWDLVTDLDQVTQLAGYAVVNARETEPITLPLKPRFLAYRAGQAFTLSPALSYRLGFGAVATKVVWQTVSKDPATGAVTVTMRTETDSKHAAVLALTGNVVDPVTIPTPAELDGAAAPNNAPARGAHRIATQTVDFPLSSDDDQIDIAAFDAVLDDGTAVSFPADTIGSLASGQNYGVFRSLTGASYLVEASPATSAMADSDNVFLQWVATSSGGTFPTSPVPPPGWGGDGGTPYQP